MQLGSVSPSGQDRSPHMSFILKGFQILALQLMVSSNPKRQSKKIKMKYKPHIELVHESYGTCFQYNVKNVRIKHLTPLLVVTIPYACWFL